MRSQAVLAAIALLAAGTIAPATGMAQGTPSSDQIVKSLTPSGPGTTTRGLRLGPAPTPPPTAGHAQPAAVTANTAPPPPSTPAVSLTVQFTTGSAELSPAAFRVLNNLGQALRDEKLASYRFRVEGHTDTVGSAQLNKELSERRAAVVVEYLAVNFQVDRSRMQAVGMGEEGLLVPTPDQTAEPRNRRVQVVNIGS